MTEIIPTDMDAHFKALIDHPTPDPWGTSVPAARELSSRRMYKADRERIVTGFKSHVESAIVAQSAEPVRHRRPSRWERFTGSPWFLPCLFVLFPVLVWALGSLLVRWVEFLQGSGL